MRTADYSELGALAQLFSMKKEEGVVIPGTVSVMRVTLFVCYVFLILYLLI